MTRKRFKRLLMAHGFESWEAGTIAWAALQEFGEYRLAWDKKWHSITLVRWKGKAFICAWDVARGVMQGVIESVIRTMADQLQEQLKPAVDAWAECVRAVNSHV